MKKLHFVTILVLLFLLPASLLLGQSSSRGRARKPAPKYQLTINTNVRGADIFVNGRLQPGPAPGTLGLPPGTYTITLRAPGFRDGTARVALNGNTRITINLKPSVYQLTINSNQRNATIFINGQPQKGRVPYTVNLSAGVYTIMLREKGFMDTRVEVDLRRDQTIFINMQSGSYNLTIDSNVQNARIFIDGVPHKARMPYTLSLSPGEYTVSLKANGYREASSVVALTGDQTLFINMDAGNYNLTVNSNIEEGEILVNNDVYAVQFPYTLTLDPGTYTITVRGEGYRDGKTRVNLQSDQSVTLDLAAMTYNLTVDSNVAGARLFINDQQYSDSLPFSTRLPPGTYEVNLRHKDYRNVTRTVKLEDDQTFYLELEAKTFDLEIDSNVSDARLFIDGENVSSDLPYIVSLPQGTYEIELKHKQYRNVKTSVTLKENQNLYLELEPRNFTLAVDANISEGQISVNGEIYMASFPYSLSLEPGRYEIVVSADGFSDAERVVELDSNQNVFMNLEENAYSLTIKSNAKSAVIFINGERQPGSVPLTASLPPGTYTILVQAQGWADREQTVNLSGDQQVIINLKRPRKDSN